MKKELSYLITILMAITMVVACGDSGGGKPKPIKPGIEITCAEVAPVMDGICDPSAWPLSKPGERGALTVNTTHYYIGNIDTADWVNTEAAITSGQPVPIRIYIKADLSNIVGCQHLNTQLMSPAFDAAPMTTTSQGISGVNFDGCAVIGDTDLTVTVYNGSYLAPGEFASWLATDEVLARAMVHFVYQ